MRIRRYIGLCAVVLAASMSASYAGPCLDEIGTMQAKIDAKLEAIAAAGTACYRQRHGGTEQSSTDSTLHSWSGGKDG
jgi:hypothetical protein